MDRKAKDEKAVVTLEAGDSCADDLDAPRRQTMLVKHNAMSNLSILLTIMSILVAFRWEGGTIPKDSELTESAASP